LLQRICTYLIILIYIGIVLDIANIPLTTFAFLGGAMALSIGLGAQNLIGNFLNGFLVILDKSLNIGDIVKIENIIGKVKSIGIRSTIIQTSDNTEMVIPNSNVINSSFTKFISEKTFLKSKIYLKIEVQNYKNDNVEERILEALGSLEQISDKEAPEIYLIEVTQKTYKYLLCYYPKTFGKYSKQYIQHLVNHALIEKLHDSKLETRSVGQ
jgi:small-conductance mechanosensitive channel